MRPFRTLVESDIRSLGKLTDSPPDEKRAQTLRSSNVPFYEAVWSTARRCTAVTGFSQRFYFEDQSSTNSSSAQPRPSGSQRRSTKQGIKKRSAFVDIIASGGAEWIKISTITETRVLFELAKQGWEQGQSSDDDSDTNGFPAPSSNASDDDDVVSIIRTAENLTRAARSHRVRYRHPIVRLVLPKVTAGHIPAIDTLLDAVRAIGVRLELGNASGVNLETPIDYAQLTPNPTAHLTPILNIDCTILLALVSDLSHQKRPPALPWFHGATRKQIEAEAREALLPTSLYPAMCNRRLVCTEEAAARMRAIVDSIGTETEKARTELLLAKGRDVRAEMAALSDYALPTDLKLPVAIVHWDGVLEQLPACAVEIAEGLSEINRSVFMYGWRTSYTTLTSNRTVVKHIEAAIERCRNGDDELVGPETWVCGMARSLIGKEKGRREG